MKLNRNKTVGYGYVGEWSDGTLGWCLPKHMIDGGRKRPENVWPIQLGRTSEVHHISARSRLSGFPAWHAEEK